MKIFSVKINNPILEINPVISAIKKIVAWIFIFFATYTVNTLFEPINAKAEIVETIANRNPNSPYSSVDKMDAINIQNNDEIEFEIIFPIPTNERFFDFSKNELDFTNDFLNYLLF